MATTTTTSPQLNATSTRAVNPALPPITTDAPSRLPPVRRISSSARERLSVYSTASQTSQHRSRPVSHVFPLFHSSLPYALVRDFAYAPIHPLHYGPLPAPSRASTPASESRRLSDPQIGSWEPSRHSWSSNSGASESFGQQLPAVSFGDGPPYSEDEDLHSPIITSRYRKHKSVHTFGDTGRVLGDSGRAGGTMNAHSDRGTLVAVNGDGSETYYVQGDQNASDGPGGEYITYPAGESRYSQYAYGNYGGGSGAGAGGGEGTDGSGHDGGDYIYDDNYSDRYSRDYHFSIGSPDEEMHGKAVALFDFTREHENELPLKEGQVILVSYRHGQGWLVAEDPRTGESGLVPEEFVRLVRDIEGGLSSLNGALSSGANDQHQSDSTMTTGENPSNTASEQEETATPTNESNQSETLVERTEEESA